MASVAAAVDLKTAWERLGSMLLRIGIGDEEDLM